MVGPLATVREPHSWDLCVTHAGRITAPRGWELVRHSGPLPSYPDDDDLVALAEAVREGRDGNAVPAAGFVPVPEVSPKHTRPASSPRPSIGPKPQVGAVDICVFCPTRRTEQRRRANG